MRKNRRMLIIIICSLLFILSSCSINGLSTKIDDDDEEELSFSKRLLNSDYKDDSEMEQENLSLPNDYPTHLFPLPTDAMLTTVMEMPGLPGTYYITYVTEKNINDSYEFYDRILRVNGLTRYKDEDSWLYMGDVKNYTINFFSKVNESKTEVSLSLTVNELEEEPVGNYTIPEGFPYPIIDGGILVKSGEYPYGYGYIRFEIDKPMEYIYNYYREYFISLNDFEENPKQFYMSGWTDKYSVSFGIREPKHSDVIFLVGIFVYPNIEP